MSKSSLIKISIIIPTYNSQDTLETTLRSLEKQALHCPHMEILVIDGGSTDSTVDIAKKYGAKVINNPHRLPEPAKLIGLKKARGQYVCFMDSDESFVSKYQLKKRLDLFANYPELKVIITDYCLSPPHSSWSTIYSCLFGDPFTAFVLSLRQGSNIKNYRNLLKTKIKDAHIYDLKDESWRFIGDGGTSTYSRQALNAYLEKSQGIVEAKSKLMCKERKFGIITDDNVVHDPRITLVKYFQKLKFRIINNIHYPQESGYSVRSDKASSTIKKRQLLYLIYCLFPIAPLLDMFFLVVKYRKISLSIHFILVYYIVVMTIWQMILKIVGKSPRIISYAK
ncbi:MAG: glycosyltransferase [Pseudomonadales bacterium]|jgi:glycosyltransferase involved in cell wall biosynthesis|nr:glycosyltransferase [Pseudomonadales bacterium]